MSIKRLATAALLLALTTTTAGAAPATPHFYGQTPCRDIALTFDAEFSATTSALVQKLEELNVTGTFFLLGQSIIETRSEELVKRIASRHQIGNHSYLHPYFTRLSPAQMRSELERLEALILSLTGSSTKPYFRPPYGDGIRNPSVLQALGDAGYTDSVYWTIDTNDWRAEQSAAGVTAAILNGTAAAAQRGQDPIVLMHGFPAKTALGVAEAVPALRASGYQFVTVAELLNPAIRAQREFGGEYYQVQAGETAEQIAACHNLGAPRLLAYNDVQELAPGRTLLIPYRNEVMLRLNGERLFFPLRTSLVEGRSMVHIRFLEHLGARLHVEEEGGITATYGAKHLRFQAGSAQVLVDGQVKRMVLPALMEQKQMLLPLSFLIEEFGLRLTWNAELQEAALTSHPV